MADHNTAIPRGSLVLVTAANGYTGSHVVIELLRLGFRVRGTVRNSSSGQWLLDDAFVSPFARSRVFEIVTADNSVPGSFDEAVKGVSAVIHVSIIGDLVPDPNIVVTGATEAALNIARSAAKEPLVQRFVFTSSFLAATMPTPGVTDVITNLDTWNDAATEIAWAPPPFGPDRVVPAYIAGKVAGEKALWKFVADEKLPWIVNSVSPCVILGDLRTEQHLRSFPPQVLEQIYMGAPAFAHTMPAGYFSHVTDVAVVHIAAAIDPSVEGRRIQVLAKSFNWAQCLEIMRKIYPSREFIDDFLPENPQLVYSIEDNIAPGLVRKWAGREWIDLETCVKETICFIVKQKNLN